MPRRKQETHNAAPLPANDTAADVLVELQRPREARVDCYDRILAAVKADCDDLAAKHLEHVLAANEELGLRMKPLFEDCVEQRLLGMGVLFKILERYEITYREGPPGPEGNRGS